MEAREVFEGTVGKNVIEAMGCELLQNEEQSIAAHNCLAGVLFNEFHKCKSYIKI